MSLETNTAKSLKWMKVQLGTLISNKFRLAFCLKEDRHFDF